MNRTDFVDVETLRDDVPDFGPGDTLKVHVRVTEGERSRIQAKLYYLRDRVGKKAKIKEKRVN